jgi:small subunit ribosomal protein S21
MNKPKNNDNSPRGLFVEVFNNDINKAMRKLKKKIADDGLMQELRQREFYESKGSQRRKAKLAAIRRYQKNRAKEQDI